MNAKLIMPDPAKAREFFKDKITFTTGPVELDHLLEARENINVVDVRAEEDYENGHIPTAINLPREKWGTLEGLSKDKTNVLYCYTQVCHLAATAACEFASKGYPVMEMDGGFAAWKDNELEVETASSSGRFDLKS